MFPNFRAAGIYRVSRIGVERQAAKPAQPHKQRVGATASASSACSRSPQQIATRTRRVKRSAFSYPHGAAPHLHPAACSSGIVDSCPCDRLCPCVSRHDFASQQFLTVIAEPLLLIVPMCFNNQTITANSGVERQRHASPALRRRTSRFLRSTPPR